MHKRNMFFLLILSACTFLFSLSGCTRQSAEDTAETDSLDKISYLQTVDDEPDTVDFQCTSLYYTVALNVYDRLVEMKADDNGVVAVVPSLAKSWEISDDGKQYTFHLRDDVYFTDGKQLKSSDVLYTFSRLLTNPESCNADIVDYVLGADALADGITDDLKGFKILDDYNFIITLNQPFGAFLACLSMPGASIMNEEATEKAGDSFGKTAESMVGTGPFILEKWIPGEGMLMKANPDCWSGPPASQGVELHFTTEAAEQRIMFENGELDILDLDELGDLAEYFMHGDIYRDRLHEVLQIGICYIALNESIKPLDDVRVRKALQLGVNRDMLVDGVFSGNGMIENGIFPHGLIGYNPDLEEIPYDPEKAKTLLAEAGYPDGFELTLTIRASQPGYVRDVVAMLEPMMEKIGVKLKTESLSENEFMKLRKAGELECYVATWIADFDDPDNFIYTFFGSPETTRFRSLCYPREDIMKRVRDARAIVDEDARIREYQELEKIIIHDDAAWIPLLSRKRYYVTSERVKGFTVYWNGSVKTCYRYMSVE